MTHNNDGKINKYNLLYKKKYTKELHSVGKNMERLIKCDIIIVVLIKICITKNNYVGKINNYRVK